MIIMPTPIEGTYAIDIKPHEDERGLFARTWDADIAQRHNLQERFDYSCISTNRAAYTLRGMHMQREPYGEVKLVRCTRGVIFDVVVDMRQNSESYMQWYGVELSAEHHRALYVPAGCAHGFLTLEDKTEVLYCIAGDYNAEAATGVRWDDTAFGIAWPHTPNVLSKRDASYPDYRNANA